MQASQTFSLRFVLAAISLCSLVSTSASAQSIFGVVLGEVRDSSGAVIRGATVRLTNIAENTKRETTSDGTGGYEFQNVKAGPYAITLNLTFEQTLVPTPSALLDALR